MTCGLVVSTFPCMFMTTQTYIQTGACLYTQGRVPTPYATAALSAHYTCKAATGRRLPGGRRIRDTHRHRHVLVTEYPPLSPQIHPPQPLPTHSPHPIITHTHALNRRSGKTLRMQNRRAAAHTQVRATWKKKKRKRDTEEAEQLFVCVCVCVSVFVCDASTFCSL